MNIYLEVIVNMVLSKKVMVLFDPKQYKKIEEKAKLKGLSVGALIRQAVVEGVLKKEEIAGDVRLKAAQRLISAEEEIVEWQRLEEFVGREHLWR